MGLEEPVAVDIIDMEPDIMEPDIMELIMEPSDASGMKC